MMEKDMVLNWMLIGNIRYALDRDNGISLANYRMIFREAITWYEDNFMKNYIINKLISEIEMDLHVFDREYETEWRVFIEDLKKLSE